MATPDEASFISFVAPSTLIDPAFWEELYQKKLNIYKLGTETEQITALYNCSGSRNSESFMLDGLSFAKSTEATTLSTGRLSANGALVNVNTIEDFKAYGKMDLLNQSAASIWQSILSLEAVEDPHVMLRFVLLTFADLKLYKFTYWFGCPALLPKTPFAAHTMKPLRDVTAMKDEEEETVESEGEDERDGVMTHEDETFEVSKEDTLDRHYRSLKGIVSMYRGMTDGNLWKAQKEDAFNKGDADSTGPTSRMPPVFILSRTASTSSSSLQEPFESIASTSTSHRGGSKDRVTAGWEVESLSQGWHTRHSADTYIVCVDTSSSLNALGWGVRNVLALLAAHVPPKKTDDSPSSSSSSSAMHTHDPAVIATQTCSPTNSSSSTSACNIIALRGQIAKSVYACVCVEKARDFLSVLTDMELVAADESLYLKAIFSDNGSFDLRYVPQHESEKGDDAIKEGGDTVCAVSPLGSSTLSPSSPLPRVVGWETNERGKPGPRSADLSAIMDSCSLMAQASDLNLRLMKWRMWPTLDTDKLQKTRCLLFGAGTLGCAVARTLLGWGVRHITFVDNGRVSYSNPSRQCLFEFEDCENRTFKAVAAASRLRKIFPGVQSEGVVLTIPMPGHPFTQDREKEKESDNAFQERVGEAHTSSPTVEYTNSAAVEKLDHLVKTHDVCFALTDSREARWLPTVLCASHDKILINAALGFDSYLVMRHGCGTPLDTPSNPSTHTHTSCPPLPNIPLYLPEIAPLLSFDTECASQLGPPCDLHSLSSLGPTDHLPSSSSSSSSSMTHKTDPLLLNILNSPLSPEPLLRPCDYPLAHQDTVPSTPITLSPHPTRDSESKDPLSLSISPFIPTGHTHRLGCYFCSDIVAATNSQRDRSLDQQCTVTRPGLSFIAGALAVEVMVALLHSSLGSRHPAPDITHLRQSQRDSGSDSHASIAERGGQGSGGGGKAGEGKGVKGVEDEDTLIPHQLRGSLATFSQISPMTPAFECCTACSRPVVQAYRDDGVAFVKRVCDDRGADKGESYLESLSGVARLTQEVETLDLEGMYMDSDED